MPSRFSGHEGADQPWKVDARAQMPLTTALGVPTLKCSFKLMFSMSCHRKPTEQQPLKVPCASNSSRKCLTTLCGMMYPGTGLQVGTQGTAVMEQPPCTGCQSHRTARCAQHRDCQ